MLHPKDLAAALYRTLRGKDKKEVQAGVTRFAAGLKVRGMARMLPRILTALPRAAAKVDAPRTVRIDSARELKKEEITRVLEAIGADANETLVETTIDPSFIGGIRIRRHDATIDATVKGKLDRLKRALAHSA